MSERTGRNRLVRPLLLVGCVCILVGLIVGVSLIGGSGHSPEGEAMSTGVLVNAETCAVEEASCHLMVFENPAADYPLQTSLHCSLKLRERSPADPDFEIQSLSAEWIPISTGPWSGIDLSVDLTPDSGIECSIYDGEHHWVDGRVTIRAASGPRMRVHIQGTAETGEHTLRIDLETEAEFLGMMVAVWPSSETHPPEAIETEIGKTTGLGPPELRTNQFGVTHWWRRPR